MCIFLYLYTKFIFYVKDIYCKGRPPLGNFRFSDLRMSSSSTKIHRKFAKVGVTGE
jgi:hypothetical protein